jgi:hypothetical protein
MAPRAQLHELLVSILGSENVYYQPPQGFQMEYPCIVYNLSDHVVRHADDSAYSKTKRYELTVMDRDVDSPIPDKITDLPMSSFDRWFATSDLNHFALILHF